MKYFVLVAYGTYSKGSDNKFVKLIDGQHYYGSDGEIPATENTSVLVLVSASDAAGSCIASWVVSKTGKIVRFVHHDC